MRGCVLLHEVVRCDRPWGRCDGWSVGLDGRTLHWAGGRAHERADCASASELHSFRGILTATSWPYLSLPQVNEKDAEVLSYCTDVRCERFHDDETGDEVGRGWASVDRSWHDPGLSGLCIVCRNCLCAFQLFDAWLPLKGCTAALHLVRALELSPACTASSSCAPARREHPGIQGLHRTWRLPPVSCRASSSSSPSRRTPSSRTRSCGRATTWATTRT